jgi:hypothetical protein
VSVRNDVVTQMTLWIEMQLGVGLFQVSIVTDISGRLFQLSIIITASVSRSSG